MELKNKPKIKSWLEQGEIGSVLTELKKQLNAQKPPPTDWLKTATSLSAQLEKLKTDKLKGIITYQEETVAMNKLLDNVQEFIHLIEEGGGDPPPTAKSGSKWWLALLPVLAFGGWWLFLRQGPITAKIRICTADMVQLNYCQRDVTAFAPAQTLQGLVVTAAFEGLRDNDPLIEGRLKKLNGDDFPTRQIQLTMEPGGVAYSSMISPAQGYLWDIGTYVLYLYYKGEIIGEKQFEIFYIPPPAAQSNEELLPIDSIQQKSNVVKRLNGLLKQKDN